MSAHKRLKRKNDDREDEDDETSQSVEDAARLMSLLHRYARENLLLANIYIKVGSFSRFLEEYPTVIVIVSLYLVV